MCQTRRMELDRIVVTGGHPTAAELAAVTAALAQHRQAAAAPSEPRSRWIRATRLEACGHPPIDSPMRLTRWGPAG